MMKKILIIGSYVKPIPAVEGGAVEQLVEYLLEENEIRKFADVCVASPFSLKAKEKSKKYSNSSFVYINIPDTVSSKILRIINSVSIKLFSKTVGDQYIRNICKTIDLSNYDLILIENKPFYGYYIRQYYKGVLVLHLHNDYLKVNTEINRRTIKSYDKIITISNFIKSQVQNICDNKIEVIYNGVDLSKYFFTHNDLTVEKKIVYAGRINREKGVLELASAFSKLNFPNTILEIIGDYDTFSISDKNFVDEFTTIVKNNKNIKLIGNIPNSEVIKHYKDAYVGVVPTIINEGLSLTAIEMLASGIPVIYSNVGGLPEVVDSNCGIGVLVDNIQDNIIIALESILSDKNKRDMLASNTRKNIKIFDKRTYVAKMVNCILQ